MKDLQKKLDTLDVVLIPSGEHTIDAPLHLTREGQKITCEGGCVLHGAQFIISADNVTLSDMMLEGEHGDCITANGASGITLKSLVLAGYDRGVVMHNCKKLKIDFCGVNFARSAGLELSDCDLQMLDTYFFENHCAAKLSGCTSQLAYTTFSANERALDCRGGTLIARDCIEWDQVQDSIIFCDAVFDRGVGFDENSIILGA